jgi:hypothetical protein
VAVVDQLELVEIDEQQGGDLVRPATASFGVLQSLEQKGPVWQPGQPVVQGLLAGLVRRAPEVGPGLGVQEVGGCHVGQRLGRSHGAGVQRPRCVPVQVERSERCVAVAEGEREHRQQPGAERPPGEFGKAALVSQVGHRHRRARLEGLDARPFAELGLELLEEERRLVRRCHVVGIGPGGDEGDPRGGDRQDIDDAHHEVIEDGLDRKVRHQGARELTQYV